MYFSGFVLCMAIVMASTLSLVQRVRRIPFHLYTSIYQIHRSTYSMILLVHCLNIHSIVNLATSEMYVFGMIFFMGLFIYVQLFSNQADCCPSDQTLKFVNSNNSFLQNAKYTATHLSQPRFCFLMQFAIYHWNIQNTKSYQAKLRVALGCSLISFLMV